jgi:hypothetical protein
VWESEKGLEIKKSHSNYCIGKRNFLTEKVNEIKEKPQENRSFGRPSR